MVVPPLLLSSAPTMVLWFSWGPSLFLCFLVSGTPLPQAMFTQPMLVLSLEMTTKAWVSVPIPYLSVSGYGVWGSGTNGLCISLLCPSSVWLLCFSLSLWGGLPGCGFLLFFTSQSQEHWSCPDCFFFPLPFLFFPLVFYQIMWRVSCLFGGLRSPSSVQKMFSASCSTWRFFFFDVLWEKVSTTFTPLPSWTLPSLSLSKHILKCLAGSSITDYAKGRHSAVFLPEYLFPCRVQPCSHLISDCSKLWFCITAVLKAVMSAQSGKDG